MGAFPALRAGNRAIRSNSSAPCGGFRYFRFYPLRGRKPTAFAFPKIAIHGNFGLWVLQSQTQEFVAAGLLPLRFCESSWLRRQSPSVAIFAFRFASQTQEIIDAGIHAGPPPIVSIFPQAPLL
jgi:hypothetical protein